MKKSVEERAFLLQQRLARRAEKGLKVPQEFLDCASSMGSLFVKTMQSFNQARALSEMIHSNEHGLSSIQEQLTEHPINALTLMNIISIERAKGESDLEKHLKTKNGQDNAQKKLDNDPKQKWKRETVKPEWENWQSQSVS